MNRSPFLLVVYDAANDAAYWVHVQSHFAAIASFDLADVGATVTIRFPVASVFDEAAAHRLRQLRDDGRRSVK
jgi:hypothetical protein